MRAEGVIHQAIKAGELLIDADGRFWRKRKGVYGRAENRTGRDYLQVRKMVKGKRYHAGAHRVVWEHFNNQRIPDGYTINHENGVKDDNRPDNLELATYSDNLKHAFRCGLSDQFGERNPNSKLSNKQVAEIRLAYSSGGFTQKQLAEKYGVTFQTISKVVRGERREKQSGATGDYKHLRQRSEMQRDSGSGKFVGKKAAGRLLDDRTWDEYPKGSDPK